MQRQTLAVTLACAMLLAAARGQLPLRSLRPAEVGTTVQAALAVPAPKLPVGAPIALELTLTTSGRWHGTPIEVWEGWRGTESGFVPWVNKSPPDPTVLEFPAATTTCLRRRVSSHVIYHLTPGRWRVRCRLQWLDAAGENHETETAWCPIEITRHEANERAMHEEGPLIPIQAWQWVVSGSDLGEDWVVPPELRGKGLFPSGTPMADQTGKIVAFRDSKVSLELVVAADLCLLRRDLRRARRPAVGPQRTEAMQAVRKRLEALAKEIEPTPTPLAGQYGEVTAVLVDLLHQEDPDEMDRVVAKLRETAPMLADQLQQRFHR